MGWKHNTLIANGPALLASRAATAGRIVSRVLGAYSAGDSYATVAGNAITSTVAMAAADFTTAPGSGNPLDLTIAGKVYTLTSAVTSPTSPTTFLAVIDTVSSEVLLVTASSAIGGASPPWDIGGTLTLTSTVEHFTQPT